MSIVRVALSENPIWWSKSDHRYAPNSQLPRHQILHLALLQPPRPALLSTLLPFPILRASGFSPLPDAGGEGLVSQDVELREGFPAFLALCGRDMCEEGGVESEERGEGEVREGGGRGEGSWDEAADVWGEGRRHSGSEGG